MNFTLFDIKKSNPATAGSRVTFVLFSENHFTRQLAGIAKDSL